MKHGKHYVDAAKLVDSTKAYDVNEALELACKTASAKFDETVELHVRLGVDGRHADQQVRGAVVLPNGTGKTVRVCAIAKGAAAAAAEAAGADIVGDDELIAKIAGGFMDFDVVVTTPDMMGRVGRLGKVLGPRGLMPNPKAGTVAPDLGKAVSEAKETSGSSLRRLLKYVYPTYMFLDLTPGNFNLLEMCIRDRCSPEVGNRGFCGCSASVGTQSTAR